MCGHCLHLARFSNVTVAGSKCSFCHFRQMSSELGFTTSLQMKLTLEPRILDSLISGDQRSEEATVSRRWK
ncbi:unnamed protein product [Protopolystoma xenopodis]|uniref:Uncharacterized protein n=1 Tax=Protopolystoma xenopodis TaxID=117903 RepID=A0A3S5AXA0_9PLAT|nr:unnamed protein product [Protopolystoma xenopodis]